MNDIHPIVHIIGIAVALGLLFGLGRMFGSGRSSSSGRSTANQDELLDPSDPRQVGLFIGITGGDLAGAALADYALRRFEETHGRKPTTRDAATVVGLMNSLK